MTRRRGPGNSVIPAILAASSLLIILLLMASIAGKRGPRARLREGMISSSFMAGEVEASNVYRSPAGGGPLEPDLENSGALQRNRLYAIRKSTLTATDVDFIDEDIGESEGDGSDAEFRRVLSRVPTQADNRIRIQGIHVSRLPPQARTVLRRSLSATIDAASSSPSGVFRISTMHIDHAWIGFVEEHGGTRSSKNDKPESEQESEEAILQSASREGRLFRVTVVVCLEHGSAVGAHCARVVCDYIAAARGFGDCATNALARRPGLDRDGVVGINGDRVRINSVSAVGRLPDDAIMQGGIVPAF